MVRTLRLGAATIIAAVALAFGLGAVSSAASAAPVAAKAAADYRAVGVRGNADGTLTITASSTSTENSVNPQILVLKLNHGATVAIYTAAANADHLATICGHFIGVPGICDTIRLLAAPIRALGAPGPNDCLAFWTVLAVPPFQVGYLSC